METFGKLVGAIDETGGMSHEEVRGMDRGAVIATLSGGSTIMAVETADPDSNEVLDFSIG